MTCHLTPGMSPFDLPIAPPMHSMMTSSCSSIIFTAPSPGQNEVTCLPFFINWTRTHFLMAEFGCFASICTFSSTIPLACEAPSRGSDFALRLSVLLMYFLECHLPKDLLPIIFLPAFMPLVFFAIYLLEGIYLLFKCFEKM